MATPKTPKTPATAQFRITLDVMVELGSMTLEDALMNARSSKVEEIIGLDGVEVNDSSIEVKGVWA